MAVSEHRNSSNQSGSRKERKENLMNTVSLSYNLYAQGVFQDLGFWEYDA